MNEGVVQRGCWINQAHVQDGMLENMFEGAESRIQWQTESSEGARE